LGNGAKAPSPLAGKLYGKAGGPLTPSHAIKSGRRYRYYVSRHLITGPDDRPESSHQEGWRLPAREIERVVAEAVTGLLSDRSALTDAARDAGMAAERIPGLLRASANRKGEVLDLVERVEIAPAQIVISLNLERIMAVSGLMVRHEIPTRIKRRGVEMRLVIEGSGDQPAAPVDAALVKAVVRAHTWFDDLVAGRAKSLKAIGKAQNLSDQYVSRLMRLAFLAPEIVEAVLTGTQPVDLTAETLINHTDLPTFWVEQKAFLGFR